MGTYNGSWAAYWQDGDLTLIHPTFAWNKNKAEQVMHRLILGWESAKRNCRGESIRRIIQRMSDEDLFSTEMLLQDEFAKRNIQGPLVNDRLASKWVENHLRKNYDRYDIP